MAPEEQEELQNETSWEDTTKDTFEDTNTLKDDEIDGEVDNQEPSGSQADELAAAKDKYLRLFAEFENFRRRTAKERSALIKTASEGLLTDLLPVVDDFERSLQIFKDNEAVQPMYEGIQLVYGKLSKTLAQKGLQPMEVEAGSDFDSEYHEAVAQTPAPEESLKGKIVDVVDKGYFLGDKVLRYAKVIIGA